MRGFTLIELMLSISITGILALGISDFYITTVSSKVKTQNIAAIERQGASALQYIAQIARNAESITLPATASTGASATFDVVDAAKDPTVIDVSEGRLRITEGTQAPQYLTDSHTTVSNLVFHNLSRSSTPGVLRISFMLTRNSQSSVYEYTFSQNFASSAALR